jgi:ABC-2 type transport system ATP-binding protein
VAGKLTDCGALSNLLAPGVRAVEIVARDVPENLSQRLLSNGAQGMRRDGALVLTFSSEAPAQEAMRAIVGAGGVLVSVAPHRQTLESLFVQRARGTTAPSA